MVMQLTRGGGEPSFWVSEFDAFHEYAFVSSFPPPLLRNGATWLAKKKPNKLDFRFVKFEKKEKKRKANKVFLFSDNFNIATVPTLLAADEAEAAVR